MFYSFLDLIFKTVSKTQECLNKQFINICQCFLKSLIHDYILVPCRKLANQSAFLKVIEKIIFFSRWTMAIKKRMTCIVKHTRMVIQQSYNHAGMIFNFTKWKIFQIYNVSSCQLFGCQTILNYQFYEGNKNNIKTQTLLKLFLFLQTMMMGYIVNVGLSIESMKL